MDPSAMIRMRTDEILRDKIALGMYGGATRIGTKKQNHARNKNGTYKARCNKGTLRKCVKNRGTGDLIGGARKYNRVCPKKQHRVCSAALWKKRNGGIMAGEGIMAGCCEMCMGSGCDMCMGSGMDYGMYGGAVKRCQNGYKRGCVKNTKSKTAKKTTTAKTGKNAPGAGLKRWNALLVKVAKENGVPPKEIRDDPYMRGQISEMYAETYGKKKGSGYY